MISLYTTICLIHLLHIQLFTPPNRKPEVKAGDQLSAFSSNDILKLELQTLPSEGERFKVELHAAGESVTHMSINSKSDVIRNVIGKQRVTCSWYLQDFVASSGEVNQHSSCLEQLKTSDSG